MARNKGYTEDDVIRAVAELMEQGRNINGSSLRSIIGTGRPANIFATYEALVEEGKIDQSRQLQVEENPEKEYDLPPEIIEAREVILADMSTIFARVNNLANSLAEKRLSAAVNQAKEMAKVSSERLAAVEGEMDQAFNQIEDQAETIESLENEVSTHLKTIGDLEKKVAVFTNRIETLEIEGGRLSQDNEERRQEVRTLQTENSEQFTQIANLTSSSKALEDSNVELNQKLSDEQQANKQLQGKIDDLEGRLIQADKEKVEAESQASANLRLLNDAKERLGELKEDIKQIREDKSELTAANGVLTGELATVKTNYSKAATKVDTLEKELSQAISYKTSIGNENNRLRELNTKLTKENEDIKGRNLALERTNAKLSKDE